MRDAFRIAVRAVEQIEQTREESFGVAEVFFQGADGEEIDTVRLPEAAVIILYVAYCITSELNEGGTKSHFENMEDAFRLAGEVERHCYKKYSVKIDPVLKSLRRMSAYEVRKGVEEVNWFSVRLFAFYSELFDLSNGRIDKVNHDNIRNLAGISEENLNRAVFSLYAYKLFQDHGQPRYQLTRSLAEGLYHTTAPKSADGLRLPYPSILLQIPPSLRSTFGLPSEWIYLINNPKDTRIHIGVPGPAEGNILDINLHLAGELEEAREIYPEFGAFVLNFVSYLNSLAPDITVIEPSACSKRKAVTSKNTKRQVRLVGRNTVLRKHNGFTVVSDEIPEGKTWSLSKRTWTSGHWRNQPCGPGRSLTKRIWIKPFLRGPEDVEVSTTNYTAR